MTLTLFMRPMTHRTMALSQNLIMTMGFSKVDKSLSRLYKQIQIYDGIVPKRCLFPLLFLFSEQGPQNGPPRIARGNTFKSTLAVPFPLFQLFCLMLKVPIVLP